MNFHILAKKNLGPGVAYNKFTTVCADAGKNAAIHVMDGSIISILVT